MRTLHALRSSHLIGALLAFALVAPGCASWRLARLPHYPAGEALPGPAGSYSLEFPQIFFLSAHARREDCNNNQ